MLQLESVTKRYADVVAVDNVSFAAERGEIVVLLGPSGCGKTTTLRLLAGLEKPDRGAIWLNGRQVAGNGVWIPPETRAVGMVFQDYALFPHLTVEANVAFPLNHIDRTERRRRIKDMLALVGLPDLGRRYPHELSGGQQQRVALARALVAEPGVVLLDEPFSNLDAALRRDMRTEVRRILKAAGATAVFVTHDQEEALNLGDRIVVMDSGRLLQQGTPQTIYLRPASLQVADFLGEVNLLAGEAQGDSVACVLGDLPLLEPAQGPVQVMLRPEALMLEADPDGAGRINAISFYGHDQMVEVCLNGETVVQIRTWADPSIQIGTPVRVTVRGQAHALPIVGLE